MKKKMLSAVGIALTCMALMTGCQQTMAKSFGGNMTLTLDPGQKLELITWKGNSLWYLTRPMQKGETAETHTFQESSSTGMFEGTVTIIEREAE